MQLKNVETVIKGRTAGGYYREIFSIPGKRNGLKIYIKSKLKVFEAVTAGEARLERELFCASKFIFTVIKDGEISFDQGDSVSVSYDGEVIFSGFVFSKERDKDGLIKTVAYDQLRYLKNKRTYTRGHMTLGEIVAGICDENMLRKGSIARTGVKLLPMAAERVSLLDVIAKAAADTENMGGGRYVLLDEKGYLTLKSDEEMDTNVLINDKLTENFFYRDTVDNNAYNAVELYSDVKKYNVRTLFTAEDGENIKKWGKLIFSGKASSPEEAAAEAMGLLKKYDRINRTVKLTGISGRCEIAGGSYVYVSLTMGDMALDGKMRVRKAVHRFENNTFLTDVYLDGSVIE